MKHVATSTDKSAALIDAVFGDQRAEKRRGRAVLAWTLALALHTALFFLARLAGPSLETWSARIAAMVHRDLNASAPTAIETLTPPKPKSEPEPEPEPESTPPPKAAAPAPTRAHTPQPTAAPAQAAQAAQVIAADAPADLTADTFVTGTANAYAGGATTSTGTNTEAVSRSALQAPAPAPAPTANKPNNAPVQAVSLTSEQWHCPWPAAALAQDLYEQFVIVRAWVRADGSVERASVLSDPGYGFGAAAVACALHTRFNPARNARGEALRALSPPIRVRFTR